MQRLDIVNAALIAAGQKPVTDVNATKASRLVNKQLKLSLDPVLSAHPWDELKKYATLVGEITTDTIEQLTITVTGTGTASDGIYIYEELYNDRYSWKLDVSGFSHYIRWNGSEWELLGNGESWKNTSDTLVPPKTGWQVSGASTPAPTLAYADIFDPIEFTYQSIFKRPFDFIRIVEEEPRGYEYDNVAGLIYGELDPFQLSYVALPTTAVLTQDWQDLPYDDVAFDNLGITGKLLDVMIHHILSRCIYGITGDHNDTQIFNSLYSKALAKVTSTQAQEQRDQYITSNEDGPDGWLGARI